MVSNAFEAIPAIGCFIQNFFSNFHLKRYYWVNFVNFDKRKHPLYSVFYQHEADEINEHNGYLIPNIS